MADTKINEEIKSPKWTDYNLNEVLIQSIINCGWETPTKIQSEVLPHAISHKDIIGLAETGSGKTGAFAIPVLNNLLENTQPMHSLILTPTRELAFQIKETFCALGNSIGLKCVVIVGGVDNMEQAMALAKSPHLIIATPGRLVDHLENTKGFNLKSLKFLVIDEADRILDMDYEKEVEKILRAIPKKRTTYLFSATMTHKVQKLQRTSLKDPVNVEISNKYQTVDTLVQNYIFIPSKYKEAYLVYLLNDMHGCSFIVFCAQCSTTNYLSILLQNLDFKAISLNGKLSQEKRLNALNKFKNDPSSILIATDVASRGLDIPHVDVVINFDVPLKSKDYIHRVGRTARAGRSGKAITMVTQYDIEPYQHLESLIDKKLPIYQSNSQMDPKEAVLEILDSVSEAARIAKSDLSEQAKNVKRFANKTKKKVSKLSLDSENLINRPKKLKMKSRK